MSSSIFLTISAVVYTLLITIIFFLKRKINTVENNLYTVLLVVTLLSLITELLIVIIPKDINSFAFIGILKLFLICCLTWGMVFFVYMYATVHGESKKNINSLKIKSSITYILFILLYITFIGLIIYLPIYYFDDGYAKYSYGPSVELVSVISITLIIISIIYLIKNIKYVKEKKYYPIIAFVVILIFTNVIRFYYPDLLLANAAIAFVTTLMYHTIENPDINLIERLNIAKEQAEKANKVKTEFLSRISHEIRTPLNAIVGISTLIQDAKTVQVAKETARDLIDSSKNLLEIVDNILEVKEIETGELKIKEEEYNPLKLLKEISSVAEIEAIKKNLSYMNVTEGLPTILIGDKDNIRKIIMYLITNAIKYTEKGAIYLTVKGIRQDNNFELEITVSDTGKGISEKEQKEIFDKFKRSEEHINSSISGLGLGLAITKELIGLMNGKISVTSKEGKGSKFVIKLPQREKTLNKKI